MGWGQLDSAGHYVDLASAIVGCMIAVHCDYFDDDRTLTAWFKLPEPLPPDEDIERGEIVGDWQRCEVGFLLRLHAWLEGRQPAPKLSASDSQGCETLH
jgi:hypothetical protein